MELSTKALGLILSTQNKVLGIYVIFPMVKKIPFFSTLIHNVLSLQDNRKVSFCIKTEAQINTRESKPALWLLISTFNRQ